VLSADHGGVMITAAMLQRTRHVMRPAGCIE